jgi:hypothetical protein
MRTKEIDFDHWPPFFNDITNLHHGERVNVETIGEGDIGVTSHVRALPLVGIVAADPKDGSGEWIEIIAGDSANTHVRMAEEDNGQAVAIQIESSRGLITMVRFEQTCEGMPPGFTIA